MIILVSGMFFGCGTLPNGRGWGQDATLLPGWRRIAKAALDAGTAWARVEGERHYPSDVLAGMAIGHFFGAFITDAFLGLDYEDGAGATVEASRDGFKLTIFWGY